jgi:hypothetical protein
VTERSQYEKEAEVAQQKYRTAVEESKLQDLQVETAVENDTHT